jgi:hypothetical protein
MIVTLFNLLAMGRGGFGVPPHVALEIVAISAALAYFDTARRHELLILANLGVTRGTVLWLSAGPIALVEIAAMVAHLT